MGQKTTIKAKLVAKQIELYTVYVFENLDEESRSLFKYITVVKCPNWQYFTEIKLGDIGFLEYEYAEASESYYDPRTESNEIYRYTANYFMNFIKEEIRDEEKKFNF